MGLGDVATKHGDPSRPGYHLLHPRGRRSPKPTEPNTFGIPESMVERLGRCYELAGRFATQNEGITLVHGSIQGFGFPRIGHAWVELEGGLVWEPGTAKVWEAQVFKGFFSPQVEQRYDAIDMRVQMIRHKHWGPWEEPKYPTAKVGDIKSTQRRTRVDLDSALAEQHKWFDGIMEVTTPERPRGKDDALFGWFAKHGDPDDPGYRLLHPNARRGMRIASAEDRAKMRQRGVVIPPAWRQVQVAEDPEAPLQATGFDAKGRLQYLYSAKHMETQAAAKFQRVQELHKVLPTIDAALERDYRDPVAGALVLIRRLGLRPGSNEDTKADVMAHGATNLTAGEVALTKDGVQFSFIGKKGVAIELFSDDPLVVKTIRSHKRGKKPEEPLFGVDRKAAAKYLKAVAPGFKLKDLRTAFGSAYAKALVDSIEEPPKTMSQFKKARLAVAKRVAAVLGNTPKVAIESYIVPTVWGSWEAELA